MVRVKELVQQGAIGRVLAVELAWWLDRQHGADYFRLLRALYVEAEAQDGYWRDGCVFAEEIDIWDTMSVDVRYRGGALLSYALNVYSPYEGWRATLIGTAGRLEVGEALSGLSAQTPHQTISVFNLRGEQVVYTVPKVAGGHGGSDARLQAELFGGRRRDDPLQQMANARAGARSVLIGAAANQSIRSGQPVAIELDA